MAAHSSETVPAGNPVPAPPPAASGRVVREGLAGLDDLVLVGLVRSLPLGSARRVAACELLVSRYEGLVRSCVRPYRGGPVPTRDLMQVGYLGLLTAIGHFDPAVGASLGAYARPCVSGELKRYFRDKRWAVRVKRPVQELVLQVRDATGPVADVLGGEDPRLEHMLGMYAVAAHWGELSARERQILIMDFRGGMTQTQIAQRLRIFQMHVSRLRAQALGHLRARLLGSEPRPVPGPARRPHPAGRATMIAA
jgi:RNA polymerase sigma-B factor